MHNAKEIQGKVTEKPCSLKKKKLMTEANLKQRVQFGREHNEATVGEKNGLVV